MALSYLDMLNRILVRLGRQEETTSNFSAVTGDAIIIKNTINDVQNKIFLEDDWYTLYKTSTFATVSGIDYYALPADWGRGIDLVDQTNDRILIEEYSRAMDIDDPDASERGSPRYWTIQGSNFRLHETPSDVYTIRYRYFKTPPALSASTDTSDLPFDVENVLLDWVHYELLIIKKQFEVADRKMRDVRTGLKKAKTSNEKKKNQLIVMNSGLYGNDKSIVRMGSNYPILYR